MGRTIELHHASYLRLQVPMLITLLDMAQRAFDDEQTVANGARDYAAYSSAITANQTSVTF
jgi:hypothetical protein